MYYEGELHNLCHFRCVKMSHASVRSHCKEKKKEDEEKKKNDSNGSKVLIAFTVIFIHLLSNLQMSKFQMPEKQTYIDSN